MCHPTIKPGNMDSEAGILSLLYLVVLKDADWNPQSSIFGRINRLESTVCAYFKLVSPREGHAGVSFDMSGRPTAEAVATGGPLLIRTRALEEISQTL